MPEGVWHILAILSCFQKSSGKLELLPQLLSKEFWERFAHLCFETCQRCEMRDQRRLLCEKVRYVSNYDFELVTSTIWWNGAKNRNVI